MNSLKELVIELINLLKQYLSKPKEEEAPALPVAKAQAPVFFRNKAILLTAAGEIGTKEVAGKGDNPRIKEYHKYSTIKNLFGFADSVPWCASFVCWVLEKSGMTSTNSQLARSFEKWGVSTKLSPLPGDIVTFWRTSPKSGYGHVGILLKKEKSILYVLGGNQSDQVNVTRFQTDKMTDIRRSSKAGVYTEDQIEELHMLANQIIAGHVPQSPGGLT